MFPTIFAKCCPALGARNECVEPGTATAANSIKKSPHEGGLFFSAHRRLFDFSFLVDDVLSHDRVELASFHLFRMVALVLGCRVEMSGTGAGNHSYLILHGSTSKFFAARPHIL